MATNIHNLIAAISPDTFCDPELKKEVKKIVKEKGLFRVFVLVEYDERAAQKRLLDQIKSNKELHEAMRTTELYEEMEREVAEFRARNQ